MEPEEAIPTGDDNSTGTPPPAAQQAQGDSGAVGEQAIPTGDDNALPEGPAQPQQPQGPQRFGPMAKIVSYLMGEGAVPPQVLQQAADQVDPESGMSASDRNVMVVHDAATRGGQDAAWKIMQANRVAYNAKQAFAYAALNGTQQKPGSVTAAVDAANQAAEHVLDGSNAHFMVSQGGQITATVKGADGGPAQVFDLTQDQFRQYLNVGGAGQWDRQMQPGGIQATLTKLAAGPQRSDAPTEARAANTQQDQQDPSTTRQGQFRMTSPGEEQYDETLQRKAWGMFPGAGSTKERAEWLASQEQNQDKLQNAVDVAKEKGINTTRAAQIRADAVEKQQKLRNEGATAVAGIRLEGWKYKSDAETANEQIKADQKAAQAGHKDAQARIESSRKAIATKRMTAGTLTPEEEAMEKQLTQSGQQAIAGQQAPTGAAKPAPTGQAAPVGQQAPAQQGAIPPAAQRVVNQVYNTPKGPHKWMGNGWQPVQ